MNHAANPDMIADDNATRKKMFDVLAYVMRAVTTLNNTQPPINRISSISFFLSFYVSC